LKRASYGLEVRLAQGVDTGNMLSFTVDNIEQLHRKILECSRCRLSKTRKNIVAGEGSAKASVMFVGEAPGAKEDLEGRPFVGAAGQFLNQLLNSINLERQDVFITNIVKCRPPQNRVPRVDEVSTCNPFLEAQVKIIQPKVICPMGSLAGQALLEGDLSIARVHGKPRKKGGVLFFPVYHPAAGLYAYRLRDTMMNDFKRLGELLTTEEII